MKKLLLLLLLSVNVLAQKRPLYVGTIPNSNSVVNSERSYFNEDSIQITENVSMPTIEFFKAEGTGLRPCVLICPGGGYWILADKHEGTDVALAFNKMGMHAVVLKYRIPNFSGAIDKSLAPLQDVQQAFIMINSYAKQWAIDTTRIGIMGFSAGGHLAATASIHYRTNVLKITNPKILRPAFSVLVYPVTTFENFGHKGSGEALLGSKPSKQSLHFFASYKHIDKNSPPAFLVHAKDDLAVPFKNSVVYQRGLMKNRIPNFLYLTEKGGHGFGMNNNTDANNYMISLENWLREITILP
jgi:acetyl esterase/lipase